ncbi:Hypothetical protein CINCED_3A008271 [Cinara cedri]|uniref:Uncharacterized protein n=1 Tax=Cinara cedri TaxID=506608 RepID=A0A5E4M721_9HEMI|nr:Hypothetical protein CINCED_3A008271 [Cinara cedri]
MQDQLKRQIVKVYSEILKHPIQKTAEKITRLVTRAAAHGEKLMNINTLKQLCGSKKIFGFTLVSLWSGNWKLPGAEVVDRTRCFLRATGKKSNSHESSSSEESEETEEDKIEKIIQFP